MFSGLFDPAAGLAAAGAAVLLLLLLLLLLPCCHWDFKLHPTRSALLFFWQTVKERQFGQNGAGSSWTPSVVLEGRVRRRMGSLYPLRNPDSERQYCEMYIHDASYGNEESMEDEPTHVATQTGQLIVLPKSCSNPDKARVVSLFSRLFSYIRSSNVWVRDFITAAEELAQMGPTDIQHHVLLIRGKRSAEAQRKRAREEDVTGRSPFAVNAGHHGRPWGLSEMCLLCPRAIAEDEKSCIILKVMHYTECAWGRPAGHSNRTPCVRCDVSCAVAPNGRLWMGGQHACTLWHCNTGYLAKEFYTRTPTRFEGFYATIQSLYAGILCISPASSSRPRPNGQLPVHDQPFVSGVCMRGVLACGDVAPEHS